MELLWGLFAFLLLWWGGGSVAGAEWLPVWSYLSANARLSCQEIKPTQCTVIAKNYVKFFFPWVFGVVGGFLFDFFVVFSRRGVLLSLLCQDLMLPFLFWQNQPDFCFAKNNVCGCCQESDSISFLQNCGGGKPQNTQCKQNP